MLGEAINTLVNRAINESESKKRMKSIVDVLRDWIVRENETEYQPIGVLNRGRGAFHKEALRGQDLGDSDFFHIESNALLLSGQFAWEGAVAITEESESGCIASHRYYAVRGRDGECRTEYLWAMFQTAFGNMLLNDCSHGAAGRNKPLNFNELMNEYIPLPTIDIQDEIAKYVRLFLYMRKKHKDTETLLHEYRTRLISDVVTGKLDVRGVVVPEYEAVEESTGEMDEIDLLESEV